MFTKWKIIAALAMTAAGAAVSGLAVLMQKLPVREEEPEQTARPEDAPLPETASGIWSFPSASDPGTEVELSLSYDPGSCSFAIVEDELLRYSCSLQAAILYGPDFNMQLENEALRENEDPSGHFAALREKYPVHGDLDTGSLQGVWVLEGENVLVRLPVPADERSVLLVTLQKTPAYTSALTSLPYYGPIRTILQSLRFAAVPESGSAPEVVQCR